MRDALIETGRGSERKWEDAREENEKQVQGVEGGGRGRGRGRGVRQREGG